MDTVSIDPPTLHSRLGAAAPLILDVRRPAAYDADSRILPGALRPEGDLLAFAAHHAVGRPVAVYCAHGHDVGAEAAARLRAAGLAASHLAGGIEGWKSGGLPTVRRRADWGVPGGSRWITRSRPKVDRIACPWLIRRFIDPLARFDFVPTAEVFREAETRGAVPFDIPGAEVSHRGDRCSFDALLEDFDLRDAALDRLATIVRGADTDRPDLAPQCAGLLAASLGLSARYEDDHAMLEHGLELYDSLHAWCTREVTVGNERHNWVPAPAGAPQ